MDRNTDRPLPASFDELIRTSAVPVLVDFWAEWCGPCRTVSPIVEGIAREYAGRLVTVKVNVDTKPRLAAQFQIQGIPTIMMFWKGKAVMRTTGAQAQAQLKQQIEAALAKLL